MYIRTIRYLLGTNTKLENRGIEPFQGTPACQFSEDDFASICKYILSTSDISPTDLEQQLKTSMHPHGRFADCKDYWNVSVSELDIWNKFVTVFFAEEGCAPYPSITWKTVPGMEISDGRFKYMENEFGDAVYFVEVTFDFGPCGSNSSAAQALLGIGCEFLDIVCQYCLGESPSGSSETELSNCCRIITDVDRLQTTLLRIGTMLEPKFSVPEGAEISISWTTGLPITKAAF